MPSSNSNEPRPSFLPALRLAFLRPPFVPDLAARAAALVYPILHEEFLERLLLGDFGPGAEFLSGMAMDGERLAGHAWIGWGQDAKPAGVIAGVVTDERYRGRGIATALVRELCRRFDAAGGTLLFLGTTNADARRIYERLGFRNLVGSVYCRGDLAPVMHTAPGLATHAHPATWRDMGRILPLYLLPHPSMVMDAGIELPSTRLFAPWRCFRIFWESWQSVQEGGAWELLDNDAGWSVASAVARPCRDDFAEPCEGSYKPSQGLFHPPRAAETARAFSLDFVWHSDYSDIGLEFVRDFLRRTEARHRGGASLFICDRDGWKQRAAKLLGFSLARPAARHMLVAGDRWALDEYRR